MNGELYASQSSKTAPSCSHCGRKLGVGFYYICHMCSRAYCYAHIPVKCTHSAAVTPKQVVQPRVRR